MLDWETEASRTLTAELKRLGIGYTKLVSSLAAIGVEETERSITNKLFRGTFRFSFYLQCMTAIGQKSVEIKLPKVDINTSGELAP